MDRPKVLVAYYSRSGHTRRIARAIAAALEADLEPLHDPTDRAGVLGFLRSGAEALSGVLVPLQHPRHDPATYDAVVVATPVWAYSVSSPVRTYLWLERERLPPVAFAATMGGHGADRAFAQMASVAGRAPIATLAVTERVAAGAAPRQEIARLATAVLVRARRPSRRRRARAA
ncbi:NAD(P)H-dependent oxidoreductase [Anaeromyxobacter sp. PSR-1]|uniref:NAD(P)H-dependent oxidoreductase n=1 Tax=unclassified Anaeromyxobacter TaxID=2620896 RepID=UPI0005E7BBCC|nr:NAD(P)H-dependent oxidoreductase [Anaeromyxobacter sp. PSR-1]GAO01839.1 flavodoxin [Anaeromyxobacter sp. PSR-1]